MQGPNPLPGVASIHTWTSAHLPSSANRIRNRMRSSREEVCEARRPLPTHSKYRDQQKLDARLRIYGCRPAVSVHLSRTT